MAKPVQYTSVEDVVSAYEAGDIPAFAVFGERQLYLKYEGEDIAEGAAKLDEVLTKWAAAGNNAVFTLSMYDSLPAGKKVKYTTDNDASFNFQLNKGRAGVGDVPRGSVDYTDLAVENAILKMKLKAYEEDEGGEVEQDALMGAIDKFMAIPGVEGLIGAIAERGSEFIRSVGKKEDFPSDATIYDKDGNRVHVRRVSGIPNSMPEVNNDMRVSIAVNELKMVLPDIAELLEKLVRLHQKKPVNFKIFVAGLRGMKV